MQVNPDLTLAPVFMFWGLCLVFLIAYMIARKSNKEWERFSNCYAILATGTIAELILSLYFANLNYNCAPNVPPSSFSLRIFFTYLFFMTVWSFIPWLDLLHQYYMLRHSTTA